MISPVRQAGGFHLADCFESQSTGIGDNFDYLIFEKSDNKSIHSKTFIIDEKHAIDDSCNLTKAGLWNKVEHVNVFDFADEIQSIKKSSEKIWRYNGGQVSDSRAQVKKKIEKERKAAWHKSANYGNERCRRHHCYEDDDFDIDEEADESEDMEEQEENNPRYTSGRDRYYSRS